MAENNYLLFLHPTGKMWAVRESPTPGCIDVMWGKTRTERYLGSPATHAYVFAQAKTTRGEIYSKITEKELKGYEREGTQFELVSTRKLVAATKTRFHEPELPPEPPRPKVSPNCSVEAVIESGFSPIGF